MTKDTLVARAKTENGSILYRAGAQFWSLEHPKSPGYGDRYGIPPENMAKFDFIETATIKKDSNFITRKAPSIETSKGGGIEVVVPEGGVEIRTHNTLD